MPPQEGDKEEAKEEQTISIICTNKTWKQFI